MLASLLDLMQQDIELQSNSEVQKAFKRLVILEPAVLERVTVSRAVDALGFGNSVSPLCVILPFDSP